ncbi:MAG: S-adenosylmethionine:tRNA ribosyltransferase-isomerase, partial [Firmicutes bacterium]|nr:S-adenosylmethionine:tRNA ribosyltransferase-isomerase [Bacillota bacterium]
MNISEFDYELPLELIAQHPSQKREDCRLLVVHRENDTVEHKHFYDIIDYLKPGDCLVMNDSKVLPARMFGVKEGTGAKIEFLLSKRKEGDIWETIVRPGKRLHPGAIVSFGDGKLRAEILDYGPDGTRIVKFMYDGVFLEILEE